MTKLAGLWAIIVGILKLFGLVSASWWIVVAPLAFVISIKILFVVLVLIGGFITACMELK